MSEDRGAEAMAKLSIFLSSVQKELENERVSVQNLIQTDPFLSAHCAPILYEYEPAAPHDATVGCLAVLDTCQIYILMVWQEYGAVGPDGLSITHREYRRAKERKLPILAFIKGAREVGRKPKTESFLKEVDADKLKYKRFGNVIDLQKEVRAALLQLLKSTFRIAPSSDENIVAAQNIEATSAFESQPLTRLRWEDLDEDVARKLVAAAEGKDPAVLTPEALLSGVELRGLVWHDASLHQHYATAAGIVLLARDPSAVFPQCRILADAFRGAEAGGKSDDHEDIRCPMPLAIERALAFVKRNTRHPLRIVGLDRVTLDEYPMEALREALVNAVAHRLYDDAGRKIMLEVFSDRVVISSPGMPPAPIRLENLRKGKYKPCSRNPVLAQCLSFFHRIEERGHGFQRMREHMVNHGLDGPVLGQETGFFQVTFTGPGENLDRLVVPTSARGQTVSPAVEAQLTSRQREMAALLVQGEELTSRACEARFHVTRPVTTLDLNHLVALGIAERIGAGRSTRYRLRTQRES